MFLVTHIKGAIKNYKKIFCFFNDLYDVLESLDLNVEDVRGEGSDNDSNMKGKHQGVQKHFLEINPRALYMPCIVIVLILLLVI